MEFSIYNTLTKNKETFKPLNPGEIKLYLCGPTVYGLLHIGNFRGPIFFNFARNWMEHLGYKVNFVYNYTDVDDKIINLANQEGVESTVISERFIEKFKEDFKRLGLRPHDHNPKVTEYIPQIISYVETLIKNNKAYEIDGEVFYSIDSFSTYGELSGKVLEDLNAGQRVEVDQRKKNPHDFVLWKPSKEGEPSWDSPWGAGRPGWHIECSAMIRAILGDSIDIHGGGIDLIFPHHENEIAQGEGCTGCKYCNYWMHNNFINMQGEKMSKSLGNIIPARVFMDEYHPEVLKFLILSTHYRSILNVSDEKIDQTFASLLRVYRALKVANEVSSFETTDAAIANKKFAELLNTLDKNIKKSVCDDFATGELIASIYEAVRAFNGLNLEKKAKDINSAPTAKLFTSWLSKYGQMMALFNEEPTVFLKAINDLMIKRRNIDAKLVEEIIAKRAKAREDKDWAAADKYRDELSAMGIDFSDTASGVEWSVKIDNA
ncbi:cysteine--tRNA ligase [Bacteriovorax sp. Seq25_V]|uniref:cysteine--tRNA ligase n=1 Tax=Bacteriovorax sp. Seq25_V TaxID=1201288 RepID=UPI0003FE18FF|nr:cysteine--tRNA ligase [Bacteriovorax sp. Seq25_V]